MTSEFMKVNTPFIEVRGVKFCTYCREEMKFDDWNDESYNHFSGHYCLCEDALADMQFQNNVELAQSELNMLRESGCNSYTDDPLWCARKELELLTDEVGQLEIDLEEPDEEVDEEPEEEPKEVLE